MQRHFLVTLLGILLIGACSAFLLLREDPEYLYVMSDDGVMTVSGLARSTQDLDVTDVAPPGAQPMMSSVYTLAGLGTIDVPVTITFAATDADTVYWYDDARAMWEPLETSVVTGALVSAQTTRFGRYAVGRAETVTLPTFVEEYYALRAMAPDGAVGYRIAVGYARENQQTLRVRNAGDEGGCGGAVMPGSDEAWSQRTRNASILVNDVQTTVTLTFVAQWMTDSDGCGELSPFRSTADRATLIPSQ